MSLGSTPVPNPLVPLGVSVFGFVAIIGMMIADNVTGVAISIALISVVWLAYLLRLLFQGGFSNGRSTSYVGNTGDSGGSSGSGGWFAGGGSSGGGDSCGSGDSGGGGGCGDGGGGGGGGD